MSPGLTALPLTDISTHELHEPRHRHSTTTPYGISDISSFLLVGHLWPSDPRLRESVYVFFPSLLDHIIGTLGITADLDWPSTLYTPEHWGIISMIPGVRLTT